MYDLSPLALCYCCNHLLSFKIQCLSERFWAISILNFNLLQQVEMWLRHVYFRQLHMHITSFLKQEISLVEDLASLAQTTGTTSKHQRVTWPELYRKLIVFLSIVMRHINVNSLDRGYVIKVWLGSSGVQKTHFYTEFWNFLTSKCDNKWIGNMYFMYVVMAWFKIL